MGGQPETGFYDRRPIKDSKMRAQEKFEANFAKPMAQRNPKVVEDFYNRAQSYNSVERGRSHHLASGGSNILNPMAPMTEGRTLGKRMMPSAHSGSQGNLFYGGYGADPLSKLDQQFKPYAHRN